MKNLGKITDPKDIITKEYIDEGIGKTVNTLEDNVAMAESDIETLQSDVQSLQTDNTATKAAVKTLQDTYVPNTRKVNNKALDADITLSASDVGALESTYKPTFVVNVTPTGNADDSATADKTYAEVLEAYNNGKSIACLVQNSFLVPLSAAPSNTDERFQFVLTGIMGTAEQSGNTLYITCSKDGWSLISTEFTIPTKTSQLTNDSGFLTSAPVTKVNNKTGAVTLTASDVGALSTSGGTVNGQIIALNNQFLPPVAVGVNSDGIMSGYICSMLRGKKIANGICLTGRQPKSASVNDGWIGAGTGESWIMASRNGVEIAGYNYSNNLNNPATYIYGVVDPTDGAMAANKQYVDNLKPSTYQNVTVATTAWVANTNSQAADQEKTDYPFMATISLTGVTANQMATVLFNYDDQIGGNFAPCAYTTSGGVIIEAKEKPSATITLASVTVMSVSIK